MFYEVGRVKPQNEAQLGRADLGPAWDVGPTWAKDLPAPVLLSLLL